MPRRASISEGWEEVSDDGFSVISAPTTDDEAEELSHSDAGIPKPCDASTTAHSTAPIPIVRQPPVNDSPKTPPALPPSAELPSVAPLDHLFVPTDAASRTSDKKTSETKGEDDPSNPFIAEEYQYESDDAVDELLDSHPDPDPAFFLRVLRSLSEIITETNQSSKELMPYSLLSHRVTDVCSHLSKQVDELIPIVANYARLWSVASREIPLDPNLHGWMSGVRVKLLGLQAEMQRYARSELSAADELEPVTLKEYHVALSEYQKQMQDFLPIMQVDFNEFQTQQMSFPAARGNNNSTAVSRTLSSAASTSTMPMPIPIRNAQPRQPCRPSPSSDMWVLRHELYRLKDEMQRTIELLSDCVSSLPSSGAGLASDVIQSYGALFNTVTLILSNHGSDWIEHGLSGGLTYAEFTQLDIVSVRDFAARLAQIYEALALEHLHGSGTWSAQMVQNHRRHMLMDEGQLDRLETLAEVLTATLSPERK